MHILIFGKHSPISQELIQVIFAKGYTYELMNARDVDFTFCKNINLLFDSFTKYPDVIIFCSGYTNIELAEQEYFRVLYNNSTTPIILSNYAAKHNIKFVYYSSDHVIGNIKNIAEFSETDQCSPVNNYGMSKLIGEFGVQKSNCDYLIIRKSLVFTKAINNFISKLLYKASKFEVLYIPKNHICLPTSGKYLANATIELIEKNCWNKIIHIANSPCVSIFAFSEYIINLARKQHHKITLKDLVPIDSSIFGENGFHGSLIPMKISNLSELYNIQQDNWKNILENENLEEYKTTTNSLL